MDLLTITKIWEAARATSAASTFFEPIEIGDEGFLDGGTGANNPVYQLWTEAGDQWRNPPEIRLEDQISCLVSVGTGEPSIEPFGTNMLAVATTLRDLATQTQATAEQFQRDHSDLDDKRRLYRFNVTHGLEKIGLEEANQRKAIIAATRNYLQGQTIFRALESCGTLLEQRECVSRLFA